MTCVMTDEKSARARAMATKLFSKKEGYPLAIIDSCIYWQCIYWQLHG